jgi:hypothetical protein
MSDHKRNPTALKFTPGNGHAAPPQIRDASGHVLDLGDEVLIVIPKMLTRVAHIRPLLHPGAPPNLMALTLVCQIQISVPRDTPLADVYRTRTAAQVGDGAGPVEAEEEPVEAEDAPTLVIP